MMPTREVPRDEWPLFFDIFSRQHEGWLVTIEVRGQPSLQSRKPQVDARDLALEVITADLSDKEDGIAVSVGDQDRLTYIIQEPVRVNLDQTEEGADAALHIESAEGAITTVRFRAAVLPETLDGILL
jgi:hypothetical protein